MDAEQRRSFETNGYVVVPAAIPAQQLAALNDIFDEHVAADLPAGDHGLQAEQRVAADGATGGNRRWFFNSRTHEHRAAGRVLWGEPYQELVSAPTVLPMLEEILGDPRHGHAVQSAPLSLRSCIRLDHDNTHYKPSYGPGAADKGGGLHGGIDARHCTVLYELRDVPEGFGGFGCIAGSHRPGQPLPRHDGWQRSWATPELRGPSWPAAVPVHRVSLPAGGAVVFSEKLMHGTVPWTAAGHERRTLFFKCVSCGYMYSLPC
jgi:ectoine hydroxylase-related dioxygenase (phytanoyl-CoA dioxygenase family)